MLLSTLVYAYKRNLYGEASLSGSNQSLNQGSNNRQTTTTTTASRLARGGGTVSSESYLISGFVPKKNLPNLVVVYFQGEKKIISPGNRSNSAIDLQAAQRANARAQYAALNRLKAGSGASLREYLCFRS